MSIPRALIARALVALALIPAMTGCMRVFVERAEVPDRDAKPGFEGRWDTNFGVVDLTRTTGDQLVGGWDQDGGRLVGTISRDGRSLRAAWSSAPTYRPPRDAGIVVWELTDDAKAIVGAWRYGEAGPDDRSAWSGDRLPATPGESWTAPMRQQFRLIFEY